jgi:hypothetical protein
VRCGRRAGDCGRSKGRVERLGVGIRVGWRGQASSRRGGIDGCFARGEGRGPSFDAGGCSG